MSNLQEGKMKLATKVRWLSLIFGLIWAIDALLKWLPGFIYGIKGMIDMTGSPIMFLTMPGVDLANAAPVPVAVSIAIVETLVAISLLFGVARKLGYTVGILTAIGIYATAENFGGPYANGSTDVGAAIMYVFVFAGLWLLERATSPYSKWTLDTVLAKKYPAWAKVGIWKSDIPTSDSEMTGNHHAM